MANVGRGLGAVRVAVSRRRRLADRSFSSTTPVRIHLWGPEPLRVALGRSLVPPHHVSVAIGVPLAASREPRRSPARVRARGRAPLERERVEVPATRAHGGRRVLLAVGGALAKDVPNLRRAPLRDGRELAVMHHRNHAPLVVRVVRSVRPHDGRARFDHLVGFPEMLPLEGGPGGPGRRAPSGGFRLRAASARATLAREPSGSRGRSPRLPRLPLQCLREVPPSPFDDTLRESRLSFPPRPFSVLIRTRSHSDVVSSHEKERTFFHRVKSLHFFPKNAIQAVGGNI